MRNEVRTRAHHGTREHRYEYHSSHGEEKGTDESQPDNDNGKLTDLDPGLVRKDWNREN